MVVYRRNGKLVVLFNSTSSTESKTKKPFKNHHIKNPEFDNDTFRKWQINLVQTLTERFHRSSVSIREVLKQIQIRRVAG